MNLQKIALFSDATFPSFLTILKLDNNKLLRLTAYNQDQKTT